MPPNLTQLHPAQAVDSNVISPQQSLAVTKKLLVACFGCVSYLRGLFPEENFEDDRACNVQIKTVKRGYSFEGDAFLNWLECGIFDALVKQYLRTIVLGIYLDKDKPTELAESYTFNVSYDGSNPSIDVQAKTTGSPANDDFSWCLGGPSLSSRKTSAMPSKTTVGEIKKCVEQLTRRLIVLTQNLHPLPDERYLTIRLYYWDDVTPSDYEPVFFVSSSDEPHDRLRYFGTTEEIQVGGVDTRYHAINIHMNHVNPDAVDSPPSENAAQVMFVDNEQVCRDRSIVPDVDLPSPSMTDHHGLERAAAEPPLAVGTIPTLHLDPIEELSIPRLPPVNNFSNAFVSSNTPATWIDSQEPLSSIFSQIQLCDQPYVMSSFDVIHDLEHMTTMSTIVGRSSTNYCKCVCNVWQDNGDMFYCLVCRKKSHLWCYGFTSKDDPRLPKRFVCAGCCHAMNVLTIVQLKDIAMTSAYRHALAIVWRAGVVPAVNTHFAKRLGVTTHKSKAVEERLESEGFLTPLPHHNGKKRALANKKGAPQQRRVHKNSATRKALLRLFQPELDYMATTIAALPTIETPPATVANTPIASPSRGATAPLYGSLMQVGHKLEQGRTTGIPDARALSVTTEVDPLIESTPAASQLSVMTPRQRSASRLASPAPLPLSLLRRRQQQKQLQEQQPIEQAPSTPQRKTSRVLQDQALGTIVPVKRRKVSKEQQSISVFE